MNSPTRLCEIMMVLLSSWGNQRRKADPHFKMPLQLPSPQLHQGPEVWSHGLAS